MAIYQEARSLKVPWLVVGIAAFVLCLGSLAQAPFYTVGEPREALVAQSMLRSGNFLAPEIYSGEVPAKPPLFHWLIAILSQPTGEVSEFTARLPSFLAATLAIVCLYCMVHREMGRGPAIAAVIVLGTSVDWFRTAVGARVDMLLTAMLTLSFLSLYRWAQRGYQGKCWMAIAASALACLTKGPVGFVLPCIVLTLWQLMHREHWSRAFKRATLFGLAAFIPYAIWFIAAALTRGEAVFAKFIYENIARFTSTMADAPHSHSFVYLFGTLFLGFLPWTMLWIFRAWESRRLLTKPREWWLGLSSFEKYSLLVCAVIMVFYSIPDGKRGVYILPMYPFLAAVLASKACETLDRFPRLGRGSARTVGAVGCVVLLLLLLSLVLRFVPAGELVTAQALAVQETFSVWHVVVLVLCFGALSVRRSLLEQIPTRHLFPASVFLLYMVGLASLTPILGTLTTEKHFVTQLRGLGSTEGRLHSVFNEFNGLSFYMDRLLYLQEPEKLKEGDAVVLYANKIATLQAALAEQGLQFEELSRSRHYSLRWGRFLAYGKVQRGTALP